MASNLDKLASNLDDEQCEHRREFEKEEYLGFCEGKVYTHTSLGIAGKTSIEKCVLQQA